MHISQMLYIDGFQISFLQDWQDLDGVFVVNQFYGVIGTRLAFGEGSRYEEVSRQWKSYQYGELDVRM